jgi:hypothetical protein
VPAGPHEGLAELIARQAPSSTHQPSAVKVSKDSRAPARNDTGWEGVERKARREISPRPWVAASTRSFSSGVHFFGAEDGAGFFSSGGGVMAAPLFASLSHCDNVGWDTPTWRASAAALTAPGPTIRFTICALNASVYGSASCLLSPPGRHQLGTSAEATSSLTRGGGRLFRGLHQSLRPPRNRGARGDHQAEPMAIESTVSPRRCSSPRRPTPAGCRTHPEHQDLR